MLPLIFGAQLARSLYTPGLTVYNLGLVEPDIKSSARFVGVPVSVSGHEFSLNRVQNSKNAKVGKC